MTKMTVKQLKEQAKALGIKGFSRMKKAELIERINGVNNADARILERELKELPKKVAPKEVTFKPQNTAISLGHSRSAEMLLNDIWLNDVILDYGCGKGRNIRFLKDNVNCNLYVDGCDIQAQIDKEQKNHELLMLDGNTTICATDEVQYNEYDKILNAHVLNVVESDEDKNFIVSDIYSKLREGGRAYFEVRTQRDVESAPTKIKWGKGWYMPTKGTYQETITKEGMHDLLTSNGFTIVEHICTNNHHIVVCEK